MTDGLAPLTEAERRALLGLAHDSVRNALAGAAPPRLPVDVPGLAQPGAAFVTLYARRALRGCVGTIEWEQSLAEAVRRFARAAALEDQRFEPLTMADLPSLAVEISRLTPLRPATAAEIDLGVHGVSLERYGVRALFLPKVATEQGWDVNTLLAQLCRKALLADTAWQDPATRLFTFSAEVVSDSASN